MTKVLCGVLVFFFLSMSILPTKLVPVPIGVRGECLPLTLAEDEELTEDNFAVYHSVICKDSVLTVFIRALKCLLAMIMITCIA